MFKKANVIDDYHGNKVYDPYRWLEEIHSNETKEFIEENNRETEKYIKSYEAYEDIKNRIKELWKFEIYSVPSKKGDYYYFRYNDGKKNQGSIYRAKELTGKKNYC